jgi:chemotaxis protein CheD
VVGMAGCRTARLPGQVLATYALGSCIGLAVYDRRAAVGGLLHFMLPDSGIDPARGRDNPYMFADTGIPLLLERICGLGADKRRLAVYAIGGAQMMDRQGLFDIGRKNCLATRRILCEAGVRLTGEAVGGDIFRTVRLEIGSGRLWLQEGGRQWESIVADSPARRAL